MKRSVCSLLMLVVLFVLQSQSLQINSQAIEYSIEERIYISNAHISEPKQTVQNQLYQQHQQPQFHNTHDQQQQQQQLYNHQQVIQHSEDNYYKPERSFSSEDHNLHQQHQPPHHHLDHLRYDQVQSQHDTKHAPQAQNTYINQQSKQQVLPQQQSLSNNLETDQVHRQQQQQQYQNYYHHHQLQQQNRGPSLQHQQKHQVHQRHEGQHRSHADSMQQVLLDHSGQQYLYARTQVEWRSEPTEDGGLSELFVQEIETSQPMSAQEQLSYYQYHQVHQVHNQQQQQQQYLEYHHHTIYSQHMNEDVHEPDLIDHNHHRPVDYCNSYDNPSLLVQTNLVEPTCRAATPLDNAASPDSTRNVPNFSHKPSHNSNIESYPLAAHRYNYESSLMGAIRHYWREVSGLCLASAIFLNWLFVVVKRRIIASGLTRAEHAIESIHRTTSKSLSKDTNSSSAHDSAFEENITPAGIDDNGDSSKESSSNEKSAPAQLESNGVANLLNVTPVMRQRSSTLRADPIPIPSSTIHHSLSTSLSNSFNSSEYNSRYSSDFESIQRLGRGGFGVVFEAKNKIDDCHYAVKRICLPLEKEARERVMREVRALAKLDHAGIVRYYNAWLETPPDEWLKQHDAQLGIVNSKDGLSFPSTDGIYERNESEQLTKGGSYGKMGESGDNSASGLFSNSPFKRRTNGYRKFLRNNSSSPSLDIVFEGSGSIRLESENNTLETGPNNYIDVKRNRKNKNLYESKNGDNNSDSEDSDFIQFESRGNRKNDAATSTNSTATAGGLNCDEDEFSISSHLTEPFSSSDDSSSGESDSSNNEGDQIDEVVANKLSKATAKAAIVRKANENNGVPTGRRDFHPRELKQMAENLHVEKVYLYIQMQLCRKDTLKDWLKTNCDNRDKTILFDLFYQIVDAVEYVHSQDLIHRDLKPSNIFFSLDGTLKIGDFGLCRAKTSSGIGSSLDLQEYVAESEVERSFEAVHTEQVGTQLYMSPEQLNGLSYNQKVDIFAMGLILLELLIPFKTQMQRVNVLFKARNNLYSEEFRSEHPKEHELVRTLLSRSPQKRPTATEIKQHELLASAQLSQPVIERIYHRRRTISSNSSTE